MQDIRATRQAYEAPTLHKLGNFGDLTLATTVGARLDSAFQAGTPLSEITLS